MTSVYINPVGDQAEWSKKSVYIKKIIYFYLKKNCSCTLQMHQYIKIHQN